MTTRRRFLWLVPASGAAVLGACSKAPEPASGAPAPSPSAAEYPTPAPPPPPAAAPAPAPSPAAAPAAPGPLVQESDPTAVALGYRADAATVDKTKHPAFAEGQRCGTCQLYQGTAGAESGPCPLFPGKQVTAKGWCASYVKKA